MREVRSHESTWVTAKFDGGRYHLEVVAETNFAVVFDSNLEQYYQLGQLVKNLHTRDGIPSGTTGHIVAIRDPDLVENRYSGGNDDSPNGEYILDIMFDSFPMYLPVEYNPDHEVYRGGFRRRTLWQVEPAPLPEFPGKEKSS